MEIQRFSSEVEKILTDAGWYVGRNIPLEPSLLPSDFDIFPIAEGVLRKFIGLHIRSDGKGVASARSDIKFDPFLGSELREYVSYYEKKESINLYPLGECVNGHSYLLLGTNGMAYAYFDKVVPIARTFERALEIILLGLKIDEN